MCDRHELPAPAMPRATVSLMASLAEAARPSGSRRRRLWELPERLHCPVIGVCLSADAIRRLLCRVHPDNASLDDYECHSSCVNAASRRTALSEQLQDALERRHRLTVARFRQAREKSALLAQWAAAKQCGDIAGALWAVVTHPQLDAELEEAVYRDVHMIQHQAGAAERIDRHAFDALAREHAALVRELGRVQQRMTLFAEEKATQLTELGEQLLRVRGESARQEARADRAEAELLALQGLRDASGRIDALEQEVARLQSRLAEQRAAHAGLQEALAAARREPVPQPVFCQAGDPAAGASGAAESGTMPTAGSLPVRTILCVGGRQGSLTNYREAVEQTGASFLYHDGGLEQSPQVLEAGLSAADVVICQTGCISHDAYWRVKDHCKRHQKQCLYVDSPSHSAIRRELVNFVKTSLPPKQTA